MQRLEQFLGPLLRGDMQLACLMFAGTGVVLLGMRFFRRQECGAWMYIRFFVVFCILPAAVWFFAFWQMPSGYVGLAHAGAQQNIYREGDAVYAKYITVFRVHDQEYFMARIYQAGDDENKFVSVVLRIIVAVDGQNDSAVRAFIETLGEKNAVTPYNELDDPEGYRSAFKEKILSPVFRVAEKAWLAALQKEDKTLFRRSPAVLHHNTPGKAYGSDAVVHGILYAIPHDFKKLLTPMLKQSGVIVKELRLTSFYSNLPIAAE